ncbi:MAG: hypothetical protein HZA94_02265 [Candidatus Vogelbacteria bacterium]|nr:hypothetical protein [Candidatus Vogelbacteria bacterium]
MSRRLPSQFELAKQSMRELGLSRSNALLYVARHNEKRLRIAWLVSIGFLCLGILLLLTRVFILAYIPGAKIDLDTLMWVEFFALSGKVYVSQFLPFMVGNWAWAYVQWRRRYNEFVAQYSDVLEYKNRLLEIESHDVAEAFGAKFGELEELKHELFQTLSADADALLALEGISSPLACDKTLMEELRRKVNTESARLARLEDNHSNLLVALSESMKLIEGRRLSIRSQIRLRENERAKRLREVADKAERVSVVTLAEERFIQPLNPLPVVSVPSEEVRRAEELCESMKTDFPVVA